MTTRPVPVPAWRVTLDGVDLTDRLSPLLISLTVSEKRGGEADQLDLIIDDRSGLIEIPAAGAQLRVHMGWAKGETVPLGLVDKGSFKVDEATWEDAPDRITVRGRSADLTGGLRKRRSRAFVGKTVSQVIGAIAAANGYTARVHPDLASKPVPALGSGPKSDAALLTELGRHFDAAGTIKAGVLIFAPAGVGQTATAKALPTVTIDRKETGLGISYSRAERDKYSGVEAVWHNKATGQQEVVVSGSDTNPKRLKKVYGTEATARQAAEAEHKRINRAGAKMTLPLALGRPDITPETKIKVTGFKSEINAKHWIVAEASHTIDGNGGSSTSLQLETNV